MGGDERSDGVGIFITEKWVDSVVSVERHSKRILILKMVTDNGILNVLMVYAPHSGKPEEEKGSYGDEVFHLVSCIPPNKMVVIAGNINGHVGSSNVGYDGTHGSFGYRDRNADGSRILRVCRWAKLSHLQHFVHEAGIPVGDICSWSC